MKKFITILLALATFASSFALASCGNGSDNVIRLCEVTHSVFYAPLYVAINNGYFSEYGIEIKLTNGGGADKVMTALTSKSADIGLMGPEATIYCQVQGQIDYPVIFGQLTKRDGSFLVSKTAIPDFKWSDLRGKHVLAGRAGGVPAMTMQYVINNAGLNEKTDLNFNTDVAFNMMGAVFEADSSVDFTTLFEPTASEFVAAGKGYMVASVGEASGEIPYTSFSAGKSYIETHQELIVNFLKAIIKGYEYCVSASLTDVGKALAPSFDGTDVTSLSAAVESYKKIDAWCATPFFSEQAYIKLQDVMDNAGYLDARVPYTSAVDNTYANLAIA